MTRLLLYHGIGILSEGAICSAGAEIGLGRRVATNHALLAITQPRMVLTLMFTGLFSFCAIFGCGFFFVVGLLDMVSLYLAVPAIVLENLTRIDGLLRLFELTRGHQVYFLECHVLLLLIQSMVAHVLNAMLAGGTGHGSCAGFCYFKDGFIHSKCVWKRRV